MSTSQRLVLTLLTAVAMALSPSACRDHLDDEFSTDAGTGSDATDVPQGGQPTFVLTVSGRPATDVQLSEGGVAWLSVSLSAPPPVPVSASVQLSQLGVVSAIPALVIFDATNYNVPQTVTLTAPKDANTTDENLELHLAAPGYADGVTTLAVKDGDVQSLIVTPNILTLSEGKTDVFTVRPAFAPSGTMTVTLASGNPSAATISPATLTFTAADFKTGKPVTVTGVADANTSDESVDLTLDTAGLPTTAASVTVADKDVQNISLVTSSVSLVEGGAAGTFGVALTLNPGGSPVVVDVASSDPAAATVSPAKLTFTSANYATPQNVTVTPVNDSDTQDAAVTVSLTNAALTTRDVTVTVKDKDTLSLVASTQGLTVNEGGTSTFTVKLSSNPITPVSVSLLSSNTASVNVTPSALTFTSADWQTPQTVTVSGVTDANTVAENVAVPLTAPGLTPQTVTVTTVDKDLQDIILSAPTASVQETGSTTVTARLAFAPPGNTTVTVASSDTTALKVSPATLTFTAANFSTPQTVTLSGVQSATTADRTANATFGGAGLATKTVAVTVIDASAVSFTVTPTSLTLTETSAPGTFTVALSKAPAANVTVNVASSKPGAATAAPATLTFTPTNYATKQTVTVTPVRDANTVTDTTSVALSASGITTQNVNVTVTDVDTQSIVVSTNAVSVTEGTSTAKFTVKLASAPSGTATVSLTSGSTAAVTVSPSSLSFTAANYTTAQTVTLTGVADANTTSETVPITLTSSGVPNVTVTATTVDSTTAACDAPAALPSPSNGNHNAGTSCAQSGCHTSSRGSFGPFTVSGTLYASVGGGTAVSQATIHIIDGTGKDIKVTTATNGNFWTDKAVAFPVTVRASKCPNTDQKMISTVAATGGSCNGCHAAGSTQGRMHLP